MTELTRNNGIMKSAVMVSRQCGMRNLGGQVWGQEGYLPDHGARKLGQQLKHRALSEPQPVTLLNSNLSSVSSSVSSRYC